MDGLINIKQQKQALSPKLQEVAEYILENPKTIMHLSITELAENVKCSEATIFRLCKELGYKGYQDFKISIAQGTNIPPMQQIHSEITAEDDGETLLNKVFHSHINALQDTLRTFETKSLEAAIAMLANAPRIEFFGSGGSATVAMEACHKFMRIGIPCSYQADSHYQAVSIGTMPEGSVIVAVSHTGTNRSLLEILEVAKGRNIRIVGITSFIRSPLSKLADVTLYTPTEEIKSRPEATTSRLVQLALVDTLYVAVSLCHQDQTLSNIEIIREAIATQRV